MRFLKSLTLLLTALTAHAQTGVQNAANCQKVDVAKTAESYDTAKAIVNTTGAAVTAVLAATVYGEGACPEIALGVGAAGMGFDLAAGQSMNSMVGQFLGSVGSYATQAMGSAGKSAGSQSGSNGDSAECIAASAAMGATAAKSFTGVAGSNAGAASAQASCDSGGLEATITTPDITPFPPGFTDDKSKYKTADLGKNNEDRSPCSGQSGDAYLKCLGSAMPDVAALTSNPGFMKQMNNLFPGKNFGDVVKGFKGKNLDDAANYIGQMSGNPAMGELAKKAVETGAKIAETYSMKNGKKPNVAASTESSSAGGYQSASREVASVGGDDMDFNKMMADMMKKLNPDAEADKKGDPQELVFRQLDLLPEEKILANKDISLFVRVGFRYRKKINDLDHLNWSSEKNQGNGSSNQ